MASQVRASCSSCGTVQLDVGRVQLVLARPDLDDDRRNVLEFTCPRCQSLVQARVSDRSTQLLASSGVLLVADAVGGSAAGVTDVTEIAVVQRRAGGAHTAGRDPRAE
jgi:hypothetical protein